MTGNYKITGYCTIRKNEVNLNGKHEFGSSFRDFREFSTALYKHMGADYPKFYKMDNLCKLGFLASELLLREKTIRSTFKGNDTGIILVNSSASLDTDRMHQNTIMNRTGYFPSPSIFVYTLPNIVIGEICIRNRITGEGTFFIQEKFIPSFLTDYIGYLLDCEIINRCIAGWLEIDRENYEALLCLIDKTDKSNPGFYNFEPSVIQDIYLKSN
jgi:hypothetical protein